MVLALPEYSGDNPGSHLATGFDENLEGVLDTQGPEYGTDKHDKSVEIT